MTPFIEVDRVRSILDTATEKRILVVGDLMLDRFIYGTVDRISPEAPVPIVQVTSEKYMPGGACNVASNIRSLGGGALVGGIVGRDQPGDTLKSLMSKEGVGIESVLQLPHRPTTVKTRVIAERQQIVRVDREDTNDMSQDMESFCRLVEREIPQSDCVIIEDYGKGVVCDELVAAVLKAAKEAGIPTGFDPKDNHELRVAGVTMATPNRKEAFSAAGIVEKYPKQNPLKDERLLQVAETLMEQWSPDHMLITLGAQGMLLLSQNGDKRHVPTKAREVYDVSGAGDTVIAACMLALAAGATFEEAADLANYAAGVVVGKLGTATCTPQELYDYME